MGKTGSVEWVKVKGRKGQIRLIASSETKYKRPGPNQKYTSKGAKRRRIKRSQKSLATR